MDRINNVKVEMVKENISSVEPQNINDMENNNVFQKTEVDKRKAVEEARNILAEKKQWFAENAKADENVIKAAKVNITKAENNYIAALQAVELPNTTVELWEVEGFYTRA